MDNQRDYMHCIGFKNAFEMFLDRKGLSTALANFMPFYLIFYRRLNCCKGKNDQSVFVCCGFFIVPWSKLHGVKCRCVKDLNYSNRNH